MHQIHGNIAQQRRSAKNKCRDRIDMLQKRVNLLSGEDKTLMIMYLRNGNSCTQLSKLAGVSETTISRRINKIINRLTNGQYIKCLRNRHMFSSIELQIAKDYFLKGMSMRKISIKRNISYYHVCRYVKKLRQVI